MLTVPLLPIERWLNCCVRGPIIEVGWMDMVWSIPEVKTAPCGNTDNDVSSCHQDKDTAGETDSDLIEYEGGFTERVRLQQRHAEVPTA